jgi:hypothetical protein
MGGTLKRFFALFLMILLEVGLFAAPRAAYATPSVGSGVQSTTAIINRIINTTPGLNTVTTTGTGAVVRSSASTAVNVGRGLTVAIPTAAEATVTVARLAGIAGRVMKAGGYVGIATMVAPWILEQSGYKVCPPPDFFCKPGPASVVPPTESNKGFWATTQQQVVVYAESGQALCDKYFQTSTDWDKGQWGGLVYREGTGANPPYVGDCVYGVNRSNPRTPVAFSVGTCPAGTALKSWPNGSKTCEKPGPDVAASEGDLGGSLEGALNGRADRIGSLYGASTSANLPVFAPGDPVTVTTTPVTSPKTTRTTTVANPDGSTSTIKEETQTEVKPQQQGSKLGDTNITYPATTTTTTTTTNNVTNVSTTTTTVVNNYGTEAATQPQPLPEVKPPTIPDPGAPPVVSPTPGEIKFPDDYNREKTQLSLLDEIKKLTGEITAKAPDGQSDLESVKNQDAKGTEAVAGITESSIGLANWFPNIPTAACVDPKVPNPVTGVMVGVPICDKVDIFQTFISGVICVFALFGCVREVQSALKA